MWFGATSKFGAYFQAKICTHSAITVLKQIRNLRNCQVLPITYSSKVKWMTQAVRTIKVAHLSPTLEATGIG